MSDERVRVELTTYDMSAREANAVVAAVQAVLEATGKKWTFDFLKQGPGCLGHSGRFRDGKKVSP